MRNGPTPESVRTKIIDMSHKAGLNGAHIGSALSCVEILLSIYSEYDLLVKNHSDTFILSKGHAALCQFAVLSSHGILSEDETQTFNNNGSRFFCHSKYSENNRISFSGGSLGLGLSFALGLSLHRTALNLPGKIVCVVGDGELDEGICWEAISLMGHKGLANLLMVVDKNNMQSDGTKSSVINSGELLEKIKSFGVKSMECDGHSLDELKGAHTKFYNGEINAIIANTVKGRGIPFMESNEDWHYGIVNDNVLNKIYADDPN